MTRASRRVEDDGQTLTAGLLAYQLTRAFVIWGLLIGQPVIWLLFWVERTAVDGPLGPLVMITTLAICGLLGVIGETIWHRTRE